MLCCIIYWDNKLDTVYNKISLRADTYMYYITVSRRVCACDYIT